MISLIERCLAVTNTVTNTGMGGPGGVPATGAAAVGIGGMSSLNFADYLAAIVNYGVVGIGPVVAFIMFGYAAFLYFTSGGDEGKVKNAKEIIVGVVIGFTLLVTMKVLLTFLTE